MIITLAGGGSTFTPGIVKSIALRKDELEVDEIRLYDINEERQRKVGVLVDWISPEASSTSSSPIWSSVLRRPTGRS